MQSGPLQVKNDCLDIIFNYPSLNVGITTIIMLWIFDLNKACKYYFSLERVDLGRTVSSLVLSIHKQTE